MDAKLDGEMKRAKLCAEGKDPKDPACACICLHSSFSAEASSVAAAAAVSSLCTSFLLPPANALLSHLLLLLANAFPSDASPTDAACFYVLCCEIL